MKLKKFFAKLNDELNNVVPPLDDELKNMPVEKCENVVYEESEEKKEKFNFTNFFTPKRIAVFATAFVIAFVSVFGAISFASKNKVSDQMIVKVDINPSVEFALNGDMKVETVISRNADGDLLLTSDNFEESLLGKTLNEAVKMIAERATELGFIDYKKTGENGEYNKITVTAIGNKDKLPENTLEDMQNFVIDYFNNKGIFVLVDSVQEKVNDYNQVLNEIKTQSHSYFKAIEEEVIAVREYATQLVLEYCNGLLDYSVEKYQLLKEISQLNDMIKEKQDAFFPKDYWSYDGDNAEILQLVEQMRTKVEFYGAKYQEELSALSLIANLASYDIYDMQGLIDLAEQGINETFFNIIDNDLFLDFTLICAEEFITDVIDFYKALSETSVQDISAMLQTTLYEKLESIKERASVIPELEKISSEEYANFLNRVNGAK